MSTKKILFFTFALAILFVPLYVMYKSNDVLSNGTLYKFQPQAYDPFDPFRGQFLRINYDTQGIPTSDTFEKNDVVYVTIGVDEKGFAYFKEAFKDEPSKGDFLVSKVSYSMDDVFGNFSFDQEDEVEDKVKTVNIEIPDNMCKYFINEDYAKRGERVLQSQVENIYIGIRIKNGDARIQDIYVKNKPLMEYLKKKK